MGSVFLNLMLSMCEFMPQVAVYRLQHFPYNFKRQERALKKVSYAEHILLYSCTRREIKINKSYL